MRKLYRFVALISVAITTHVQAGNGVWTSAGPDGGIIYELEHDPNVPGTMYVTSSGGFFKSDDGGASWTSSNDGIIDVTNAPIIVDADAPGHLYVFDFGNRLYKSTDYGTSWVATGYLVPSGHYVWFAADEPGTIGRFYVTASDGSCSTVAAPLLLKTSDSGQTFAPAGTGLPNLGFYDIEIEPGNPSHMMATVECNNDTGPGIFRSTNGGSTWTGVGPNAGMVSGISFGAGTAPNRTLYACVDGNLHRSGDSGQNWVLTNTLGNPLACEIVYAHPTQANTVFFSDGSYFTLFETGLQRSVDGGVTATALTNGLTSNPTYTDDALKPVIVQPSLITADPGFPGIPQSALWVTTLGDGLYRSIDGGTTWTTAHNGLRAAKIRALAVHPNPQTVNIGSGAGNVVFAGFGDTFFSSPALYRSTNGGGGWVVNNTGLRASLIRSIAFDPTTAGVGASPPAPPNSATVYAVGRSSLAGATERYRNAGLYKSTNGGLAWSVIDGGLPRNGVVPNDYSDIGSVRGLALDLRSCASPPASGVCANGPLQTAYAAADGFRTFFTDTVSVPGTRQSITRYSHRLVKSTNAGTAWSDSGLVANGFPPREWIRTCPDVDGNGCDPPSQLVTTVRQEIVPAVVLVSPSNANLVYASTFITVRTLLTGDPHSGVFRSSNGGLNWAPVNQGLPRIPGKSNAIYDVLSMAMHPSNDQILWATVVDTQTPNSGTIYKTQNGGTTWTESGEGLRGKADIRALVVDPSDTSGNTLYASGAGTPSNPGSVYKSENGGASWKSISIGLPADSALSIAVDPFNFSVIHAGTNTGVWSLTQVPDDDGDGVPDGTENNAPNGGDGNGDSMPDASQAGVSSTVIVIRRDKGAGGFFTSDVIAASSTPTAPGGCQQAVDVQAQLAAQFGRDYLPDNIRFYKYPRDLVRFEVLACSHAVIDLTFHNAAFSTEYGWSFRFFGPLTPGDDDSLRWREFSSRAQRVAGSATKWRVTLDANQFGAYRPVNDSVLFVGGPACYDDRLFRSSMETQPDAGPPTCDH